MAIRTYKVTLDSKNSIAPEPVFLRQGDKTGAVVIDATLMDNGAPVSLDGLTPMFKANTADGQAVIADSTGFSILDSANGEFTYQVPSQLGAVDGKIKIAYFSFSDSSGAQSTFNVVFVVEKAVDMTQESAKDWVSNLNEIIDQYNQWVNNAHSSWQDFVSANEQIIESIDPGGTLLEEIINARTPRGANAYSSLGNRLDAQDNSIYMANDTAENASNVANEAIIRAQSIVSGTPNGAFETVSDLESHYPAGDNHIYVVKADKNWYYWDGEKWQAGGEYLAGSDEDFTKNTTRQKLNQFNLELNKGKRLAGTNDDGSIKISDANESAYVSFSAGDMTEGVLRVPIYPSFNLGQFIIVADENDTVIYLYGYQALIDNLNAEKNTQFFSFDGTAYVDISIKQLMAAANGTPAKILLGFPVEADKNHLNIYLKNSIKSEKYMEWIKKDELSLSYQTNYATAPTSRDSNGRLVYGSSNDSMVKKFNLGSHTAGDLIITTPTEMPNADGLYNTGGFIYLTDDNENVMFTSRYSADNGQPVSPSNDVLEVSSQYVRIHLAGVSEVGATQIIMVLPANVETYYVERYEGVFDIAETDPSVKPTDVSQTLLPANFNIPKYVPFTEGEDTYLYFDNLLIGKNYYLDHIKAEALGMLDDKVVFNKTASMNRDIKYNDIYTVNVPMEVVPKQISGEYKILCIGESTTEADEYIDSLKDYLDTSGADFTLLGTRKTDKGNSHEGYGGWGAGTLHYVQSALGKDNAFYNPETKIFDYDYYLEQHPEQELPDIVQINFGINDTNRFVEDATGETMTQTQHIQFIIDQIKAKSPEAKFIIGLTHSAARWTNFNNVSGVNRDEISSLVKKTNADFGGREEENIYLNPMYVALDPFWDMQYEEVASNRNSTHKTYQGVDSHHPSSEGYKNNAYMSMNAIKYAIQN